MGEGNNNAKIERNASFDCTAPHHLSHSLSLSLSCSSCFPFQRKLRSFNILAGQDAWATPLRLFFPTLTGPADINKKVLV
jgi:hypothetical protein